MTYCSGSFRDPAGRVFSHSGEVYRQINRVGRADYDQFVQSGLAGTLASKGLLVPHDDLGLPTGFPPQVYKIIRPKQISLVTYPYEWCFSQLKDAALLTLAAQREALAVGMSLKDASAFNVQFSDGRPVLIDTLSFEKLRPGPWRAYQQFCRHFLAPLALTSFVDPALSRLSQLFIDGIPLSVASQTLPVSTWIRRGPLVHIHLHAWAQRRFGATADKAPIRHASSRDIPTVVCSSLEAGTARLKWRPGSSWVDYEKERPTYTPLAQKEKVSLVSSWIDAIQPGTVWDLGANTGRYSRLASERGARTTAFDQDVACVETMYLDAKARGDRNLLPLLMDLTNPSPALGWASQERASFVDRGPVDLVLALALVHHLALGNNVPLGMIASFLSALARNVLVEFVPPDDPMAAALIADRKIGDDYRRETFETAFAQYFRIERMVKLTESQRVLYWMRSN